MSEKLVMRDNTTNEMMRPTVQDYIDGVLSNNRTMLARAITLIESNTEGHISTAQAVLKELMPFTGKSVRVGITGSPGAGKSTMIDVFGSYLCNIGKKVAVLAIDPSSSRSRGSILGDKTRMETLSVLDNAFIRPSPSGGTLGGVARKTRETILLCEVAGYDVILIETIGVGQSEITVRSMVDFLLLVIIPTAGDELQGFKKGNVELADAIVINKAEGDLLHNQTAIHYLIPATEGWQTPTMLASALNNEGIKEIWDTIADFCRITGTNGIFEDRRKKQVLDWVYSMIEESIKEKFYHNTEVQKIKPEIENMLINGGITPINAVQKLLSLFFER
jgi:LAO/AO transport system kinase